jgi:shikimate dehydrogenase
MISGKTRVFGLFGHPVGHSFSPGMHNAAFKSLGIDACYVAFPVSPEGLGEATRAIIALGIGGVNVTVPHKERVLPFLDGLSEEARLIGAVNTIEVRDGRLIGHNTDGRGFVRALRDDGGFAPEKKSFLIIGAGGAGRAIGFSLALAGASRIGYFDVDVRKATALAEDVRSKTGAGIDLVTPGDVALYAGACDCLVNATPLGMKPSDPLPLGKEVINGKHLVFDIVYNPPQTKFLTAAKTRGAKGLKGIGMLLYQGVIAFEVWTGKKAPAAVMKRSLVRQMSSRR